LKTGQSEEWVIASEFAKNSSRRNFFFTKRNNFAKSISLIRTTEIPALELFDHAPASSFRGVKKSRIQLCSAKS
jgi:hypothetical protein